MSPPPLEIAPQELKLRLDNGEPIRLVDVREPFEHQQARIPGAELIPMRTIPGHLPDLRRETRPLVVICHHGVRSLQVATWLREQGLAHCQSLSGGTDQWSREIDPAVPRY